jgi:hypothetical protein
MCFQGDTELGFLSTTTRRKTAIQYAQDGLMPIIFKIERGMMDRGASIGWASQYLLEEEVLFPPLCNLEV